jgi:4-amino-4-deoxy-L-arabinose transferase-like glycosyltransferase
MIEKYIVASILTPFLFVIPGFFIASFLKKKKFLEVLSISFFFSYALLGIFGLLLKLLGIGLNFPITLSFVAAIALLFLVKFKNFKRLKIDKTTKLLILIFLLGYFAKVFLQIFIPFYPLGGDWFENYEKSLAFFSKDWKFEIRPPLFNYLIAFLMSIFGKDLWVAQIASAFLNSIFIFPFFLLAKKFFDEKIAILSTIFVSINPLLVENALYIWPKNFVGFFVLLFFYLLLEKGKNWFFLGGIAGLSLLTHQLSLFYLLTGLFVLYAFHKTKIFFTKGFFVMILTALVFLSPWVIYVMTHKTSSHVFLYYPFAVEGYERVLNATFPDVWKTFSSKPLYYIFGVRIINLANTLFPVIPMLKIINLFIPLPTIYLHKVVNISSLPLAYHYFHSIPGNLSLFLSCFTFLGIIKIYKMKKCRTLLLITLLPLILTDLFYGWIVPGLARQTLQPIIPLLILIGVWYVNSLRYRKWLFILILLLAIVETAIFVYSYYDYFLSTWKFLSDIGVLNTWIGQKSAYNIFKRI